MALKIVEIFGEIRLRDRAFKASIGHNLRSVSRLTGSLERLRQASLLVFAGITGSAALIGRTYGEFEQAIALIQSITRSAKDEMHELASKAREMGATTIFTASEAAKAMAEMARAGLKNNEILEAIYPTLNLAASAQIGLSKAVKISIAAMRNMNIPVSQLTRVVDALSTAADDAQIVVEDLGAAMRRLGPVAELSNQSLEMTFASLVAIGKQGIIGREAGTQLRSVLLRVQRGTEGVEKGLAALGLTVRDLYNQDGNFKDLADLVDIFNARLSALDPVTRKWAIVTIAGMRNTAAFSKLLEAGGMRLREMAESYKEQGVAAIKARIQIDTFFGSLRLLLSAFQELAIQAGEKIVPLFRVITDVMRNFILTMADMPDGLKELIGQFALVVTGALGIIAATYALITVFSLLFNPLAIIAIGFSTLLSTLILVNLEGDTLEKKILSLHTAIQGFVVDGLQFMRDVIIEVAYWIAVLTTFIQRFDDFIEVSMLKVELWAHSITRFWGDAIFKLQKWMGLAEELEGYDPTGLDTQIESTLQKIKELENSLGEGIDVIFRDLLDRWLGVFDKLARHVKKALSESPPEPADDGEENFQKKKREIEFKFVGIEKLSQDIQEAIGKADEKHMWDQLLEKQQNAVNNLEVIKDVMVDKFDRVITVG